MPRLVSLLKLKKNTSPAEENLQMRCTTCGKRATTSEDGLCNKCRFDNVLTQLTERK